jgi:hypothetical protein
MLVLKSNFRFLASKNSNLDALRKISLKSIHPRPFSKSLDFAFVGAYYDEIVKR